MKDTLNLNDMVLIKNTGEKAQVIFIDEKKETYLVAKNCDKNDIQFYNISKLEKIK